MLAWPTTARNDRQLPALTQKDDIPRRQVNRDRKLACGKKVGMYVPLSSDH
jgi:hypothetical protein